MISFKMSLGYNYNIKTDFQLNQQLDAQGQMALLELLHSVHITKAGNSGLPSATPGVGIAVGGGTVNNC
jgi:hypothetical protein